MVQVDPYLKWVYQKKIIVFVICLPSRSLSIGGARYPTLFQEKYFSLKFLMIF